MIKYLIHISDIHIKSYQKHDEYQEILVNFIEKIKPFLSKHKQETRIVVTGDVFDNFLTITNEMEIFGAWFLKELDNIGTTIVVAGNHDLVRNNMERVDSITPFFKLIDFKNTSYMDLITDYKSGCIQDENVVWVLYSIFDNYSRPNIEKIRTENPNKIFIGLFHGPIVGSKNEMGFTMSKGINPNIFDGCDFVCAGDIHKKQLITNKSGVKIYYPSTLIQKTFGENVNSGDGNGHGYSIITLPDFKIEHQEVENPYGFYNFRIENVDDIINNKEILMNK